MAATALDIIALATLIGALACGLWLLPVAERGTRAVQARALTRLVGVCLAGLSLTSLGLLVITAQAMSGASYTGTVAVIPAVLLETHYGTVWLVRIGALSLLWLAWWAAFKGLPKAGWLALMLGAAAALAFSRSASGHAADTGDFSAHEISDWLHLLTISLWAGSVIAASIAVFPCAPDDVARQGGRISRLATAALGIVLASGIYNAWQMLGPVSTLWTSVYGQRLLIKLGLVALMLGLGVGNRYLHLRHLANTQATRRFNVVLDIEAAVAVAAMVAAAVMINTRPPH